jgi:hypothetical protein
MLSSLRVVSRNSRGKPRAAVLVGARQSFVLFG